MLAAYNGHLECLKYLVQCGGDRQQRDKVRNCLFIMCVTLYLYLNDSKSDIHILFLCWTEMFHVEVDDGESSLICWTQLCLHLCEIILIYIFKIFVLRVFWVTCLYMEAGLICHVCQYVCNPLSRVLSEEWQERYGVG